MKKFRFIALFVVIAATNLIAMEDSNQYQAYISVQNVQQISDRGENPVKVNFTSVIWPNFSGSVSSDVAVTIPTDIDIRILYLEAYQQGAAAVLEVISKDPFRVVFKHDKDHAKVTIKFGLDFENSLCIDEAHYVSLELSTKVEASQSSEFFKNKSNSTMSSKAILNYSTSLMDIYVQGYLSGAQMMLNYASSRSLQILNYEEMMANNK